MQLGRLQHLFYFLSICLNQGTDRYDYHFFVLEVFLLFVYTQQVACHSIYAVILSSFAISWVETC